MAGIDWEGLREHTVRVEADGKECHVEANVCGKGAEVALAALAGVIMAGVMNMLREREEQEGMPNGFLRLMAMKVFTEQSETWEQEAANPLAKLKVKKGPTRAN